MTEWNKLKVPDLRAELRKRGLSHMGLKADLVARLVNADNESGFESETTVKGDTVEAGVGLISPTEDAVESKSTLAESPSDIAAPLDLQTQATHEDMALPASAGDSSAATVPETRPLNTRQDSASSKDAEILKTLEPEESAKLTLPRVDTQEFLEDKQRRKRRSKSPLPSELDTRRKRARPDDGSDPTVSDCEARKAVAPTSKADVDRMKSNGVDTAKVDVEAEEPMPPLSAAEPAPTTLNVTSEEIAVAPATDSKAHSNAREQEWDHLQLSRGRDADYLASTLQPDDESSTKTKDSRFKELFMNQPGNVGQESNLDKPRANVTSSAIEAEAADRYVTPSIHPATSALYIRDFMRPLNAASLKEHLTILATAPGTIPDPDTIVDFYIDPIRTHAFISFKSISSASRVRSELHNRIWPNERNRKPLWADFIPSENVRGWIAEEQSSSDGSRSAGKKWEVVFNINDDRSVTATLQEAGSLMAPARKPSIVAPPAPTYSTIEGVPSGPRAQQINGQRSTSNRSTSNTFFKYTNAKPVLYYQPVSREIAENRLNHLEDATSKHYSSRAPPADIHRYTFEDGDVLVDRGPEIFSGIRPPPGYRGRGGGGGSGRGGGYRSRGGDRYEGSRRDAWDSRDRDRDRDRR